MATGPETTLATLAESRRRRIFICKRKREGTTAKIAVLKEFFDVLKMPEPA